MTKAIRSMYSCTKNIMKSVIIESSIGVRQGAPTSCLLFILYIENEIGHDDFLGDLHALLLMDDTAIVATTREMCERKLDVLRYCNSSGMVINEKKTKFFVINGNEEDKSNLKVRGVDVGYIILPGIYT